MYIFSIESGSCLKLLFDGQGGLSEEVEGPTAFLSRLFRILAVLFLVTAAIVTSKSTRETVLIPISCFISMDITAISHRMCYLADSAVRDIDVMQYCQWTLQWRRCLPSWE